ncbi:dTDP-glucose 4,6-dehydratase [Spirillospora sp. NBC_00431]
MKVLVTGGAGFIGSHYTRDLLAGAHGPQAHVTVVDKLTYAGDRFNLPDDHPRMTFVRGDVRDRRLLMNLLPGHDAVVHFAAESHVDRSISGAAEFVATNVEGTHTLLDCCLHTGIERFVHISTDEVYGSIERGAWDEEQPLQPNSPYAASKGAADLLVRAFHRTHGLATSIVRCSNNYGPRQFPEKLIPLFVTNLLEGADVPLYGDGSNVREWIHVHDHCRAIQLVLDSGRPGAVYNVGGGTELTNIELTGRLLAACDADWSRVKRVPDRKGHDRRYALDTTKIRDELGFEPQVPFDEGLADTVRWFRENRWWWEPYRWRMAAQAPADGATDLVGGMTDV